MVAYKYQKQHASNYNYKGKRSFGQRIKNFFTIPEEDLKEEPSKEFEKIKLFKLTRGSLFLGILVFMILINILVGFNINFLYIRQILGFLFLILVPGLLIMLCFKIRTVKFWEYLVYTVGLSIAFIMFAGLAVNWTLPALGITDKPLSLWPILICFDIFLLGLWLTAIYRNKDLKPFDITIPKLDNLNRIFFIIPMIFPLLSILGAFLLNNHGPNVLTMILYGGIAVYVLLLVILRKRLDENIWPWAILMISLALSFSCSFRSWYVNGGDVNKEYHVFMLSNINSIWELEAFNSTYNAMLSVSILPTVLSFFIKINSHILFKICYPLLFIFVPLVIYLISRNYFKYTTSFLSSFFFISQEIFFNWTNLPTRQEIAFIFFSLMFLIIITKNINSELKKILFVIFGSSMIVSHYSTSYIALGIFILYYLLIKIYKFFEYRKIKKERLDISERSNFYITGPIILLLLVFGFFWYNQITPTSEGLISFAGKSISNFQNMFSEEVQLEGKTPLDHFNLFFKPADKNLQLNSYIKELEELYPSEITSNNLSTNYIPKIINPKSLPQRIDYKWITNLYLIQTLLKNLMKVFIIFGSFLIILANSKKINIDYKILISSYIISFTVLLFLPFISIQYSILRAYQQFLIFLSIPCIIGISFFFNLFNIKKIRIFYSTIIGITFFLFMSGFIFQLTGGINGVMRLNNEFSWEYDVYYTHKAELDSVNWIFNEFNGKNRLNIYSDMYIKNRFIILKDRDINYNIRSEILPYLIKDDSYIYLGYSNLFKRAVYNSYQHSSLSYNFPTTFLDDTKSKLYNNGGSEVFR